MDLPVSEYARLTHLSESRFTHLFHEVMGKSPVRYVAELRVQRAKELLTDSTLPVLLVLSEAPYVATAALGARVKKNDYRSIDIGILAAYITAEAAAQGLGSCIIGWLDDGEIRKICGFSGMVR